MRVLKEVGGIDVVNSPMQDGFFPIHRACWGRERRHAETVGSILRFACCISRICNTFRREIGPACDVCYVQLRVYLTAVALL